MCVCVRPSDEKEGETRLEIGGMQGYRMLCFSFELAWHLVMMMMMEMRLDGEDARLFVWRKEESLGGHNLGGRLLRYGISIFAQC